MPDIPPGPPGRNRGLLALAVVGVLLYCGYLGWQSVTRPAGERARVLRYARDLPKGHRLGRDDFVEDESLLAERPGQLAGAIASSRRSAIVGHATRRAVEEGELVRGSDLAPPVVEPAPPKPAAEGGGAPPGPARVEPPRGMADQMNRSGPIEGRVDHLHQLACAPTDGGGGMHIHEVDLKTTARRLETTT